MTELLFRCSDGIVQESLLRRSFFASWGRQPKPSRVRLENGLLAVDAEGNASGTLHVPWPHERFGVSMESTDTLLPRAEPHLLLKELGRGSLGRILRRMYEWQMFGFRPSGNLRESLRGVIRRFADMATGDERDPATEGEAGDLLRVLDALLLDICDEFTEQSLTWRLRSTPRLPLLLGVGMGSHPAPDSLYEFGLFAETLGSTFHAVAPAPSWNVIEPEPGVYRWEIVEERLNVAARHDFRVLAGPLIVFDPVALPDWLGLRLNEDGFFESAARRFVEAFADRFDYLVDAWILSSRFNSHAIPGIPVFRGFSILRTTAAVLRSISPDKTVMVGIDQPWGEYGLRGEQQLGVANIAEAMMTCPDIDAFLLELNWGFGPDSTYPRDPMALGTLIDQWSFLGKKIYVSLSVPSDLPPEVAGAGNEAKFPVFGNTQSQRLWTQALVRMIFSKRSVHGILWNMLQDSAVSWDEPHGSTGSSHPHSGLFDEQRRPKPVCEEFASLRRDYVK